MCLFVCVQTLYIAITRFVLSKKCLDEDAQEFRMLIRRSARAAKHTSVLSRRRPRNHLFLDAIFMFTMTKLVFAWGARAGRFSIFILFTST